MHVAVRMSTETGDDRPAASDRPLTFSINGQLASVEVPTDATLLEMLRYRLRLTSVRFGCGEEQCGACMVLVDGRPVFSCTFPARDVAGSCVETADSLSLTDALPAAILSHQAAQCAFCTTGILMSATALLRSRPKPDREDVVEALQPHLCRCGSQPRIIDAIMAASRA